MNFSVIGRLILVIVVTVVLGSYFLVNSSTIGGRVDKIISYMPIASHQSINCAQYCYSQVTPYALSIMFGDSLTERNYMSVNALPLFFSCNYQLLAVATQALEIARWSVDKPAIVIDGIKSDDGLFFTNGLRTVSISDVKLGDLVLDDCSLDADTMTLSCYNEFCKINDFSFFLSDNNLIKLANGVVLSVEDLFNNINACYSIQSRFGSILSYPCIFRGLLNNAKWYYFNGGQTIDCRELSNPDICSQYEREGLITCSKLTCSISGDCKVENNVLMCNQTDGDKEYHQCTAVYYPDNCLVFCGDNPDERIQRVGYIPDGDYFVSDKSNNYLFNDVIGYKLRRVFITDLSGFEGKIYGIVVSPDDYVLVPNGWVVMPQEGLRNFKVSFDPTLLFKSAESRPVDDNAWVFRGEVSIPHYFENATMILYSCLANGVCDDNELHTFNYFKEKDSFLRNYPYINLLSTTTLNDTLGSFTYSFHNNSFLRTFSVSGSYDACNYEPNKYPEGYRPAWQTLIEHSGSCEDLALMDYSLFKALGVSDEGNGLPSISLNMSYCAMPCSCRELLSKCNISYTQISCAGPQIITIKPLSVFGSFNACPPTLNGYPQGLNGSTYLVTIGGRDFIIHQNFTVNGEYYYPVFLHPDLFNGVFTYYTPDGMELVNDYCVDNDESITDLLIDCSNYVSFDERYDFQSKINEVCNN